MSYKRWIRGGRREYRRHGISAVLSLLAWYVTATVTPNLRSRYYTTYYERDVASYDVPIDPYTLIWVDPTEIAYKTNRERSRWASFAADLGCVRGGDWDLDTQTEFTARHASFVAHFEDGVPWEETQFYRDAMDAISNGEYAMRMSTSEDEVRERCREIDDLYERMRREGYKTQEELGTFRTTLDRLGNEIQVDIGRDGSLLFVEGRHRLSLAKILDFDEVPAVVVCRHERWVERLAEHYRRGERVDHPDWDSVRA